MSIKAELFIFFLFFLPLLPTFLLCASTFGHCASGKREASVLMQKLSYPTETVLSNKITEHRIVLSFKDSPRKPLGRPPGITAPTDGRRDICKGLVGADGGFSG